MDVTSSRFDSNHTLQTTVYQASLLFVNHAMDKITKTAIYYFSPKQTIRPDSFLETFYSILPKIRDILSLRCWKLQSLFKVVIPINEGLSYIESLSALKKLLKENTFVLSLEEKTSLKLIFDQSLKCNSYLKKFDFFISAQDPTLAALHNDCKKLLLISDNDFFDHFYSKIERLSKLNFDGEIQLVGENEKLNVKDVGILGAASTMKSLAESLYNNGITEIEILVSKWSKIEMINESSFFNDLKKNMS